MNSPRIILLAHGSSDKRWCATFEALAEPTLKAVSGSRIAYMELAEPSLNTVIHEGLPQATVISPSCPCFWQPGVICARTCLP